MGTRLSSDCSRGGQSARSQLAGAGPEAALACAALVEADGFELLETVAFGGDFRAAAIRAALVRFVSPVSLRETELPKCAPPARARQPSLEARRHAGGPIF